MLLSLPARGVWVEITRSCGCLGNEVSLPARGVWVEINDTSNGSCTNNGHSPRGECGLKFVNVKRLGEKINVTPREGSVG